MAEGNTDTSVSPVRPTLSFESVTFSDGTVLTFGDDEIVVFVGPNNAGKSAALREMQQFISQAVAQNVIKNATFRRTGDQHAFREYLESNSLKVGDPINLNYTGYGYSIHHSHLAWYDGDNRSSFAGFFCTRLATETRITASNPAGPIALFQAPPGHPIHLLMMDNVLAERISGLFRHAFGKDLIVFRAGGGGFPLYVGQKPTLSAAGEDELSRSFIERLLANAVPLDQQGDGMRSFATVLLYALAADNHSIQFLDEPEAFLHPPQARLVGEFIARERKSKSQLFIATHSTDVVEGLIASGAENVRIVRIQRDGSINRVRELSREKTSAIATDTLARYSGVFDGIFYQHVMICESDADCLFYSSILKTKAISGDRRADVLFIHTSGKHRMGQLAETLRELDVPISVVADIDLFKDENDFKNLFQKLGGDWADIEGHFQAIKTSVEKRRPPLNAEQVANLIHGKLVENEIKYVFKTLSPWHDVKRAGRAALPPGQAVKHYDDLVAKCASVGLWIVPVGELEGFCRSIDGGHGPSFVAKVLEERSLETDPELKEARDFVSAIWARARPKP
jgi:ABC-type transporter Mla maintaining outer membrane lipid asymmetry ATPase subunit MlaF